MAYTRDELRWNGWGLTSKTFDLRGQDEAVWAFVAKTIGRESLRATPAVALEDVELPPSRASDALQTALSNACAASRVKADSFERAFHSYGRSYPDMLRLRSGELASVPDLVVYPKDASEVQQILYACVKHEAALVPFGGGSSVVGGVEAFAGVHSCVVTLDTTLMTKMIALDPVSHTATFEAGIYGPELENRLQRCGFTLGHFPQSFEFSTLGGWIAARGAGQVSGRYGTANKWLVATQMVTPSGMLRTLPFPQSAAGPGLNDLVCGSEGLLGVITEAEVKVHPLPSSVDRRAYLFRDFQAGAEAIRQIVQAGISVAMLRLSDSDETYFFGTLKSKIKPSSAATRAGERMLGLAGYPPGDGHGTGRCALMIGLEGEGLDVRHSLARTLGICIKNGGVPIGKGPGASWEESRFAMPYLRDPMLDRGIGIDTLETSTTWSNVAALHQKVRTAIRAELGEKAAILCHISHSYPDGCSLYFTFFFDQNDEPLAQWRRVKVAASNTIQNGGGTISHHHGVGRDHRAWMADESGSLGIEVIRAAKSKLDPKNVLNPGKLLP